MTLVNVMVFLFEKSMWIETNPKGLHLLPTTKAKITFKRAKKLTYLIVKVVLIALFLDAVLSIPSRSWK